MAIEVSQVEKKLREELRGVTAISAISGGDINQALKVETGERELFVKWHRSRIPGMFAAEARGLEALARVGAVRVPEVVLVNEMFLVLEWLEMATSYKQQATSLRRLGEGLARLHLHTGEAHGFAEDNFIGRLPQRNEEHSSWVKFWGEERLLVQMELTRKNGVLTVKRGQLIEKLVSKLGELMPDRVEPSLLHGDLWGGNWSVVETGEPVVFDPAVSFGHREVDLAMMELFGGFGEECYESYNATWEIEPDYSERRRLYQLYPLMVHWNLFGEEYGVQVERILREYV